MTDTTVTPNLTDNDSAWEAYNTAARVVAEHVRGGLFGEHLQQAVDEYTATEAAWRDSIAYEQGRQCALAITDDTDRMQVYRQSWRTRADPEAEGFRSVVMSGHEGAR